MFIIKYPGEIAIVLIANTYLKIKRENWELENYYYLNYNFVLKFRFSEKFVTCLRIQIM